MRISQIVCKATGCANHFAHLQQLRKPFSHTHSSCASHFAHLQQLHKPFSLTHSSYTLFLHTRACTQKRHSLRCLILVSLQVMQLQVGVLLYSEDESRQNMSLLEWWSHGRPATEIQEVRKRVEKAWVDIVSTLVEPEGISTLMGQKSQWTSTLIYAGENSFL